MRKFIVVGLGTVLVAAAGVAMTTAAAARTERTAVGRAKAAAWPVVRAGDRGERVRMIQSLLTARGLRVTVDGVYGRSTTTAVKAFQRARRLAVDGRVGPASWAKLVVTLRRGSRGAAVRGLQHQLRFQYRDRAVVVNGVFGASTEKAIKQLQSARRLHADGVVGVATWKALEAQPVPGASFSFNVDTFLTVTSPVGTRVTLERTNNGNCAFWAHNWDFTTDRSPWGVRASLFNANNGGICAFERTAQQFKVTAYYPDGTSKFRLVNFEQRQASFPPDDTTNSVCAYGDLPCRGGDASGHGDAAHYEGPIVPLTIGGP